MVFKLKVWDRVVFLSYGLCLWKIKLKKWFSGTLICEFFPTVLLWCFEAGVHIASAAQSLSPRMCKALSLWEVQAEFWKEEGGFSMRFVETSEGEGMRVSQLLSPGFWAGELGTWWEKGPAPLILASPSSREGWEGTTLRRMGLMGS